MQLIGSMTTSTVFGQGNRDCAKKLLGAYQDFIDKKPRPGGIEQL